MRDSSRPGEFFSASPSTLPEGGCLLLLDGAARLLRWNRAAESWLGPLGEWQGRCVTEIPAFARLIPPAAQADILDPPAVEAWRLTWAAEATPDGEALWELVAGSLVGRPGEVPGILLTLRRLPAHPTRLCAHCKSVANGQGAWQSVEAYVEERLGATLRQEMCPACIQRLYPALCVDRPLGDGAFEHPGGA
jgi:hypothetical protein